MLRRFQISVEGNVGIGKSCFIARLGADLEKLGKKVHIALEPIEHWTNWEGKYNLLGMQYTTPKQFAMPFQLAACISKCEQLLDTPPCRNIADRALSRFPAKCIFACAN